MSQSQRTGLLNVQIRTDEHQQAWEEAEKAVASVLDKEPDELTRETVAREVCEAYVGRDACGRWREE